MSDAPDTVTAGLSGLLMFWRLAALRFRLLVTQRIGWLASVGGLTAVLAAMLFAEASFLKPAKIFWDFTLGASFTLQILLAAHLGSHLLSEERGRRTLHLLLASGIPRGTWLAGNLFGVWLSLGAMNLLWLGGTAFVAWLRFGASPYGLAFQTQWVLASEIALVTAFALLASLFMRTLLAFTVTLTMTAFLHSVSALERIFSDAQTGRLVQAEGAKFIVGLARFLPPLEWFDLRVFVGYRDAVPFSTIAELTFLGFAWAAVFAGFGVLRLKRMDL